MGHLSCMFKGFHNSQCSECCYLDLAAKYLSFSYGDRIFCYLSPFPMATEFPVIYQKDDMVPLLWPQNFLLIIRRMTWFLYYELSEAEDKVSYYGHIIINTGLLL